VKPLIARRGTEHGSGLGTQRWVVERAFAHLHWLRRLRIRWEIRDDIHEAFLTLGCRTHLLEKTPHCDGPLKWGFRAQWPLPPDP
jgi:hypothetical protein